MTKKCIHATKLVHPYRTMKYSQMLLANVVWLMQFVHEVSITSFDKWKQLPRTGASGMYLQRISRCQIHIHFWFHFPLLFLMLFT